jgi:hypothetical protein
VSALGLSLLALSLCTVGSAYQLPVLQLTVLPDISRCLRPLVSQKWQNCNDKCFTAIRTAPPAARPTKKGYDLNTANDAFLGRYAGSPFPEAIDANEKELAEVRVCSACCWSV